MEKGEENPLLSNVKSTSGLQVILHPLVLLTISDYITRHVKRHQEGPIVCGLLGQTNGREITIEHAFDCQVLVEPGGEVMLADDWFCSRLEQSVPPCHQVSRDVGTKLTRNVVAKNSATSPPRPPA